MIKAITYWSFPGGLENELPVNKAMDMASKADYQGLELCVGEKGVLCPDTPPETLDSLKREIGESPLIIETLASGFSWGANPLDDDESIRSRGQHLHREALRIGGELGLEDYLLVPGVVKSPISDSRVRYDRALERARAFIESLLEQAQESRVRICIENVWNGLFYSPVEFLDFVQSFQSEWVGIYFDVGNVLGHHQHPPHWIEILGEKIYRVHIKDFKESVGTLDGFCDLLEGDVPWEETMEALRAIGYDRTVVAEMVPPNEGIVERTSAAMDKILKM